MSLLCENQELRSFLLFLNLPENFDGTSIDARLTLAPVKVFMHDKYLPTTISAFENQRLVGLKVSQENTSSPIVLTEIELLLEK